MTSTRLARCPDSSPWTIIELGGIGQFPGCSLAEVKRERAGHLKRIRQECVNLIAHVTRARVMNDMDRGGAGGGDDSRRIRTEQGRELNAELQQFHSIVSRDADIDSGGGGQCGGSGLSSSSSFYIEHPSIPYQSGCTAASG